VPGFDPRYDYYTGNPDQTTSGGAPSTVAGYGPNTRTIMQFQVVAGTGPTYNLAGLQAATGLPAAYVASQPAPIVPQVDYPAVYAAATNTYLRIQDTSITYTPLGQSTPVTKPLLPKAIQELFDPYGRMNATLGLELPFTNIVTQTTIPLQYIDPATEIIGPGETQFWKITHNGVDTHTIHFHLVNVQVINRVGWDGAIRPPDPNELGWKEAVRMHPLEDCIVAVRAIQPIVPFAVPESVRLLAPTLPPGIQPDFTNIDKNGNPTVVSNDPTNFGWEYVWHCHLLGHEENDMMRPFVFNPNASFRLFLRHTGVGGTGQNQFWYMDGVNVTSTSTLPAVPDLNWQVVGVGDFNGDGKPDLLWRNSSTGQNVIWFMDGDNPIGYGWLATIPPAWGWQIVGVGDFNHDGKPDILWRNSSTGANVVWYMNGATQTGAEWIPTISDTTWQIMGVGDFNHDGKPDILWQKSDTVQIAIWYMDGVTPTGTAWLPTVAPNTGWQLMGVGDMNSDVSPDLIWQNPTSGLNAAWYMDGANQIGVGLLPNSTDLHWQIQGRH
jgi:hypothetical protein